MNVCVWTWEPPARAQMWPTMYTATPVHDVDDCDRKYYFGGPAGKFFGFFSCHLFMSHFGFSDVAWMDVIWYTCMNYYFFFLFFCGEKFYATIANVRRNASSTTFWGMES